MGAQHVVGACRAARGLGVGRQSPLSMPRFVSAFFLEGSVRARAGAWGGLAVFVGYQLFRVWMKVRLNEWYGRFYNVLQIDVPRSFDPLLNETACWDGVESASGPCDAIEGSTRLASSADAAMRELYAFAWIVAPAIVVSPLCGLARNWWIFCWRQRIITAYLRVSPDGLPPIEGASQRVHEDTERFASGVQACCAVILESAMTLVVFLPILTSIDASLAVLAVCTALGAVGASMLLGRRLVDLEVENQVQEAALRRHLVLAERVERDAGSPHDLSVAGVDGIDAKAAEDEDVARARCQAETYRALDVLLLLRRCYWQLYTNFACLSTWLSALDQALAILPYLVVTPRLFEPQASRRLTLGDLTRAANAFGKVFDSLNILSENYLAFNSWRSVLRRLLAYEQRMRQFETPRPECRSAERGWRWRKETRQTGTGVRTAHVQLHDVMVV